jgi:anti-anti-sigma regulatory factor
MFELIVNDKHNLVMIFLEGDFDETQAQHFYEALESKISTLKKGFRALTDLSSLENFDVEAHHFIEKAMDLCNQHGISKIIRIIPDSAKDIGYNIMSLFHYSPEVEIHTYLSFKEALIHLFRIT